MNERNLMENLLQLEKGACDLFFHGTLESSTFSVHQAFGQALTESLGMQSVIYDKMAAKAGTLPNRFSRIKSTKLNSSTVPRPNKPCRSFLF